MKIGKEFWLEVEAGIFGYAGTSFLCNASLKFAALWDVNKHFKAKVQALALTFLEDKVLDHIFDVGYNNLFHAYGKAIGDIYSNNFMRQVRIDFLNWVLEQEDSDIEFEVEYIFGMR